jgi:hypothetical protein
MENPAAQLQTSVKAPHYAAFQEQRVTLFFQQPAQPRTASYSQLTSQPA